MKPLVSAEAFLALPRPDAELPRGEDGEPDAGRIEAALRSATGIIAAHLPWLLDGAGEIALPAPAQFAAALEAICADLALDRLVGAFEGSEGVRNRYKESLALLEKINREHQGGLEGPGLQRAEVVVAGEGGIDDCRFWKKGGVF